MAAKQQSGFTLIEVLLATVLVSLLMLTAMMAYSYMQQNWQRQQASANVAWQNYHSWQLLNKVLSNTRPKMVFSTPPKRDVSEQNQHVGFYFLGREDGYTAMSAQSMQQPDTAAIYRLFREPDAAVPEKWQLIYEEALLDNTLLISAEQTLPFNYRRILAAQLSDVHFTYKGWQSIAQRLSSEDASTMGWYESYDGMSTQNQPVSIRMIIDESMVLKTFVDDSATHFTQLDKTN